MFGSWRFCFGAPSLPDNMAEKRTRQLSFCFLKSLPFLRHPCPCHITSWRGKTVEFRLWIFFCEDDLEIHRTPFEINQIKGSLDPCLVKTMQPRYLMSQPVLEGDSFASCEQVLQACKKKLSPIKVEESRKFKRANRTNPKWIILPNNWNGMSSSEVDVVSTPPLR